MVSDKTEKRPLDSYVHQMGIQTRWMDNDIYGHVNNVAYYSYFDTAVNQFLIDEGLLDINEGPNIGLVVETGCRYFKEIAFPDALVAGIGVSHIGTSSVRYEIGLFIKGEDQPVAEGHFIHVYVDREDRRPSPISDEFRTVLSKIKIKV